MNVKAFALAAGLLLGVLLFLATLVEAARGEGHNLILLAVFFIGYSVTYLGSLVALVYGFVSGALIGAAFAWLYNRFAGKVRPA
jgi:ascorbate-specific PTS system EIIC-type component UlaA